MKQLARSAQVGFIVVYLGLHAAFLVAHMMGLTSGRGFSYFFTWDMYGGHSPWTTRVHVVGEDANGRLNRLLPGPWASFQPHGQAFRHDRDWEWQWREQNLERVAETVLERTRHDPITSVYVVEEYWLTKYNLPESLWQTHYGVAKDPAHYFRVREVFAPHSDRRRRFPGLESELLSAAPMELATLPQAGAPK